MILCSFLVAHIIVSDLQENSMDIVIVVAAMVSPNPCRSVDAQPRLPLGLRVHNVRFRMKGLGVLWLCPFLVS